MKESLLLSFVVYGGSLRLSCYALFIINLASIRGALFCSCYVWIYVLKESRPTRQVPIAKELDDQGDECKPLNFTTAACSVGAFQIKNLKKKSNQNLHWRIYKSRSLIR